MKNFYFILKYITFSLLLSSCSKWGVVGPERLVGDTELVKVAEIEISPFINKLIYSEPYLLALRNNEAYLINLIEPSKPVVEDSIETAYTSKIAFSGDKVYILRTNDSKLIVYNLLTKPAETDTFIYKVPYLYYQILFSKGNIFLRKSNGFDVISGTTMNIVYSYTASDSSNPYYQQIFVDDNYLYFMFRYNPTCLVFSTANPDSLDFITTYEFQMNSHQKAINIKEHYLLSGYRNYQYGWHDVLLFEDLESSLIFEYITKYYYFEKIIWDSDFVFSVVKDSCILMFGSPYIERKKFLFVLKFDWRIKGLTSSNDYLFCHSYNEQTEDSKLLIYKIIKYDRPWEK